MGIAELGAAGNAVEHGTQMVHYLEERKLC